MSNTFAGDTAAYSKPHIHGNLSTDKNYKIAILYTLIFLTSQQIKITYDIKLFCLIAEMGSCTFALRGVPTLTGAVKFVWPIKTKQNLWKKARKWLWIMRANLWIITAIEQTEKGPTWVRWSDVKRSETNDESRYVAGNAYQLICKIYSCFRRFMNYR